MSSNDVRKKGICITLGISNAEDLQYRWNEYYKSIDKTKNKKYFKKDGTGKYIFNKSKAENDFYSNNIKFDKVESQEDIELLFKLKQTFMIKTI